MAKKDTKAFPATVDDRTAGGGAIPIRAKSRALAVEIRGLAEREDL